VILRTKSPDSTRSRLLVHQPTPAPLGGKCHHPDSTKGCRH